MGLLFILLFILPSIAFSQKDTTSEVENEVQTFDVQLGIPLGASGTALLGGSYTSAHHLFQVRYLIIAETLAEKALLYGYKTTARKGTLSIGFTAGIGHLSGSYVDYPEYYSGLSEFGLALQLATLYPVNEYFGGGISLHANANLKKTVTTYSITIFLGKLY